jgi:kynurenine formamidase
MYPEILGEREDEHSVKGWKKGKGWGWIWGKDDEVGALNALTAQSRASALRLATHGQVYDLGMTYSRRSYKWPGHSPGEIITFRSPGGIRQMNDADAPPPEKNSDQVFWHSAALFMSDNVATQIDGLCHITAGIDEHWYNGFKESDWGGDWGPRKCDAATIPPIIARGVLIDVAAWKRVDALPGHTTITTRDLKGTLAWEGATLLPGDVVLVRTGTGRYWGADGADHRAIAEHDSAGPDLAATRWLIEDQGAIMVGSDTSGYEVSPPAGSPGTQIPVHRYLLVDQGVHLGEFHYLEQLSHARAYTFCYVATVNKIKGAAAGFALRPLALR